MKIQVTISIISLLLGNLAFAEGAITAGTAEAATAAKAGLVASASELKAAMAKSKTLQAKYEAELAAAELKLKSLVAGATDPTAAAVVKSHPPLIALEQKKQVSIAALETSVGSCSSAGSMATICLTEFSPHIQTAVGMIGTIVSSIKDNPSMSPTDACKKQEEGMSNAKKALTLYNAACALAQARCSTSCDGLMAKFEAAEKEVPEVVPAKLKADPMKNLCQGYKLNMMAAGVGLMNMLTESGRMSKCDAKTTVVDCAKNPYDPSCAKNVDCSKTENYQHTTCICQRTPTAAGCAGYAGTNNGMPSVGNTPAGNVDDSNVALGAPTGITDSIPVTAGTSDGTGASSLGGSGSGAGAAGFGVGDGTSKSGGADAAKKEKGLNANILGGFDGGGGGGGSRSSASLPNSAYKAYLPGGSHDPGGTAVKVYGNGEVTGSGSKTNWEKVSERYSEARPSLKP